MKKVLVMCKEKKNVQFSSICLTLLNDHLRAITASTLRPPPTFATPEDARNRARVVYYTSL